MPKHTIGMAADAATIDMHEATADCVKGRKTLSFVTTNPQKSEHVRRLFAKRGVRIEIVAREVPEIQDRDLESVAKKKATAASELIGGPALVEDFGILVEGWSGMPGPFTKWFVEALTPQKLALMLRKQETTKVQVCTVLAYCDAEHTPAAEVFCGTLEGEIQTEPKGIAVPNWLGQFIRVTDESVLSEESVGADTDLRVLDLLREEKYQDVADRKSHRAQAFQKFLHWYLHQV
uniref:Non-canonical purine NTP pyrophosphatase n=1 Tax=Chromera velia CCMP2878 TaxID=1169474 RepID=A0A0G4H097_9ALVE|eukprot:Cvel_5482.t1-p1 / transcript=Cvel_5482.t1 / gene=Cvel_5482 / organism=Chromera_velia_CCMP2878 / gene_product=Non-canonical purine NTP pyrophosphatase, putative / transcript_product=Non-canonical purine NTP pyrophosphatase, putative / location=Cvel_scaffold256:84357-85055(+) / protein_length=233 / sequence_SO=supercontig / SO=protein_coding / is_pseudo=false